MIGFKQIEFFDHTGTEMKGDVVEIDEGRSHTCVDYILVGRLFLCMVQRGGEALLREIIAAGVDVNVADPSCRTLLLHAVHLAATCTDKLRPRIVETVSCLLQNGADANLADDWGQTPLSLALTLRQKDLAWLLLEHGAEATPGIQ